MKPAAGSLFMSLLLLAGWPVAAAGPSAAAVPVFKSGVDLVTVSAIVRDQRGRMVTGLKASDFEVLDAGMPRTIVQFRADRAPASVALLIDTSGSMEIADKIAQARVAATALVDGLDQTQDETAVYAFDTGLRTLQPFSPPRSLLSTFAALKPYGATSLYDAIAQAARREAVRPVPHRAVVVFTDGLDNASRLTPAQVSGLASSIDVPIYVVAVVSPLDRAAVLGGGGKGSGVYATAAAALADLGRWTGGGLLVASSDDEMRVAMQRIVADLHHQYLLAFTPGLPPGWHPLVIRTRNPRFTVDARGGYMAGGARPTS
ncbi:MAG: VWA domain-containing protein [Acidobacteriota bacterium]|nr:VWA domain-containing protein [Acidobacteriota bacterium]